MKGNMGEVLLDIENILFLDLSGGYMYIIIHYATSLCFRHFSICVLYFKHNSGMIAYLLGMDIWGGYSTPLWRYNWQTINYTLRPFNWKIWADILNIIKIMNRSTTPKSFLISLCNPSLLPVPPHPRWVVSSFWLLQIKFL